MASLGDIFSIAHVLKRALDLYKGCASAPEEIYLARDHIDQMRLCLQGVDSDIINNPKSFVHQKTDIAKSQTQELKKHVGTCERALKRTEGLLKTYHGFKGKHVSFWDRFRWSTEGKKEIGECKSDLVFATSLLDMFLQRVGLSVLWRIESLLEAFFKQVGAPQLANLVNLPNTGPRQSRPRSGSNVTRTIVISLFLAKLRKALRTYRKKKQNSGRKPNPGPKKPKPVTRVNSGFKPSKKRNDMIEDYTSRLANTSTIPPPPYTPRKIRPRTPSPDFYYIPGGTATSPAPRPIRRSSSMQRLMGRINASKPKPTSAPEHYECWKVGVGNLAIGLKTAPLFSQHKRGQMQLRKIGAVFKEAAAFSGNAALTERDSRVKLILNERNKSEKKKNKGRGSGKKWYFVSGRVIRRDPGKTGMVSVEKAMVVLVRR